MSGPKSLAGARAWLRRRRLAAPALLMEHLDAVLSRRPAVAAGVEPDQGVPGALADAALAELRRALESGRDRAAAMHLLAADALLTYAFEAAAEIGPEAVHGLGRTHGPARLAALCAVAGDEESTR